MTMQNAVASHAGGMGVLVDTARITTSRFRRRLCRSPLYNMLVGGPSPTAIRTIPQPVLFGDPRKAAAFYRGRFDFAGLHVETGARSPFDIPSPSARWTEELLSFEWLRHLDAAGGPIAGAQARASVADWIHRQGAFDPVSWRPSILSRRLTSWINAGELILGGAAADHHDKTMASLARQLRYLAGAVNTISTPADRLSARCTLTLAFLCLEGCERYLPRSVELLGRELERQVAPDGGHISRSPNILVKLLMRLIPLRECFGSRELEVPQILISTIDRMIPMLRLLLHTDGGLAAFNGINDTLAEEVAAVLDADTVRGRPLTQARFNGYQRLSQDRTTVIVDTGSAPPMRASGDSQAGCLSFELSHGRHRVIVNCGAGTTFDGEWCDMARATAAHSTATVNNRSSGRIARDFVTRFILGHTHVSGPRSVRTEREDSERGSIVEAQHDGYLKRLGITHSRRLYLDSTGGDLRGEDCFRRRGRRLFGHRGAKDEFAVRFHLHPSVRATLAKDASSVLLLLPNHVGWKFSAIGGEIEVDDSVYLVDTDQPRRTRQIIVHGLVGDGAVVKWALKKSARRGVANQPKSESSPQLPFEHGFTD